MKLEDKFAIIEQASDAIEALIEWDECDCGCPDKRRPKNMRDIQLIRMASQLRVFWYDRFSEKYHEGR